METMEWRKIEIVNGYEVSNTGLIKNTKTDKVLDGKLDKDGYHQVQLRKRSRGINKYLRVHRLIAEAFLENPFDLPQVDHIDRDVSNNHVSNLRWVSSSTNNSNRKDTSKYGPHLTDMTLGGTHHYWRLNFHQKNGLKLSRNINKKDMSLENVRLLRDILSEDLVL